MVRTTLINFNVDRLHYYPFIINMNRFDRSCNTLEDPFGRTCVPNKMEGVNLKVSDMIKGINESKHISFECICDL